MTTRTQATLEEVFAAEVRSEGDYGTLTICSAECFGTHLPAGYVIEVASNYT